MNNAIVQAANVVPPTKDGMNVLSVTTTGAATDLDGAGWFDEYITLQADGGDVYVLFAASTTLAAALDDTATGTGATVCAVIQNGTERSYRLRRGAHKALGYKTATGTAKLRVFISSDQAGL
jgi:hypothetical protein